MVSHPEIITKVYDFLLYLLPQVAKFPRSERYLLGERLESAGFDCLENILEPIFEPTFIFDSYATRKRKGTHAAIDRFQKFAQSNQYVLKCDIRKYFPSIDS